MTLKIVLHVDRGHYRNNHDMMQAVVRFMDGAVDDGYVQSNTDADGNGYTVQITHGEIHVESSRLSGPVVAFNPDDNTTGE